MTATCLNGKHFSYIHIPTYKYTNKASYIAIYLCMCICMCVQYMNPYSISHFVNIKDKIEWRMTKKWVCNWPSWSITHTSNFVLVDMHTQQWNELVMNCFKISMSTSQLTNSLSDKVTGGIDVLLSY